MLYRRRDEPEKLAVLQYAERSRSQRCGLQHCGNSESQQSRSIQISEISAEANAPRRRAVFL